MPVRGKREVRYIVFRLEDPNDPESTRQPIGCFPHLDLAKKEADRYGSGGTVDAQGGSYSFDGARARQNQWRTDWINPNIYQGRQKKRDGSELHG